MLSCGRYSERNPLEVGLVTEPWQWRWSSCRAYALGEPDPLLAAHPWYDGLASTAARRQGLWRSFLMGEDAKEEVVRREDWIIGSESFRRLQRQRARPAPRRRGRPIQKLLFEGT